MRWLATALLGLTLFSAAAVVAQEPENWTTEQKREWLRDRFRQSVSDPAVLADAEAKLDRMTEARIDALVVQYRREQHDLYEARLADAKVRLARDADYRDALAAEYQQRLAASRDARAGFAPVITTLPSGASLSAGAVVSPDRRHVRVSATPFFSSVGPVATFSPYTGAGGYYPYPYYGQGYPGYGYNGYPGNGYPAYGYPGVQPYSYQQPAYQSAPRQRQLESYYDGLRTRYRWSDER